MTIALFGATGQLGRIVLNELSAQGHTPRVLVRIRMRLSEPISSENVFEGDVREESDVEQIIRGADAVISAIGMPDISVPDTVVSAGLKTIISVMQNHRIKRIVAVGGASALPHPDGGFYKDHDWPEYLKHVSAAHVQQWQLLKDSGLDWTLVCPVFFHDEVPKASYRVERESLPQGSDMVTIDNLANFIVEELSRGEFVRSRVGIVSDRPAEDAGRLYD